LIIDQVVVSKTLELNKNINHSETPPEVALLEDFLMMIVWHKNNWLWTSNLLAKQVNRMIILEHMEYIYVVETYLYTLSYVKEKNQSVLILDIDDLNTGYTCIYIQGHHVACLDLNI
jgi:hypothetical protein